MNANNQLKYVVLSDLHLGEEESLFTPQQEGDFSLVHALSEALADLLHQFNQEELPSFIFNGDILGLSFSTYQEALTVFSAFTAAFTKQNKICERVIYIPGNHDHHIWNMAKEERYINALKTSTSDNIPELQHTTKPLYKNGLESTFFQAFMGKELDPPTELKVFYPNFLLPPTKENDPFVFFHHGHFAEDTYHFVSKAMQVFYPDLTIPATLNQLEAENGNWIDFAFSELGRSGEAGEYFTELMATLSSEEKLEKEVDELSQNLADNVNFPYLPFHFLEKMLSKTLLNKIGKQVRSERYRGGTTCSDETMQSLLSYLSLYCKEILEDHGWTKEKDTTLVWSHTHKPFEKTTVTEKLGHLKVFNTGGWTLPTAPIPTIGGAILLINENNEVQSLRIFNDGENGGEMHFSVCDTTGTVSTAFGEQIMHCLYEESNQLSPVWNNLKTLLQEEIRTRRNKTHA